MTQEAQVGTEEVKVDDAQEKIRFLTQQNESLRKELVDANYWRERHDRDNYVFSARNEILWKGIFNTITLLREGKFK